MTIGGFEVFKREITDYTADGKCSCCGECCSNLLPLSEHEIKRIHKYIEKRHIKAHKRNLPLAEAIDMTCPFRNEEKRICEIYEIRPLICKLFKCDKEPNKEEGILLGEEPRMLVNMRKEFFKEVENA